MGGVGGVCAAQRSRVPLLSSMYAALLWTLRLGGQDVVGREQ